MMDVSMQYEQAAMSIVAINMQKNKLIR